MKPMTGRRWLHMAQILPAAASSFILSSDGITELMAKHFCSFRVVPLPLHVNTHLWPPTCVNEFICWHTCIYPMKTIKGKE